MAASSEMLASLERINNRIAKLESSFQEKLFDLQQENILLKNMIADIDKEPNAENEPIGNIEVEPAVSLIEPIKDHLDSPVILKSNKKKQSKKLIQEFNSKDYMAGVFAYQQDNFQYVFLVQKLHLNKRFLNTLHSLP